MKAGIAFEQVVADVFAQFDPGATVKQGVWQAGPDGRRNMDVLITGGVGNVRRTVHIECKDHDPNRGKLDIDYIDALDSKHHDLNVDVSMLCSNAGFTAGAVSKAKRKNIGLIGILRSNDSRVKYEVFDEAYRRRIELGTFDADYTFPPGQPVLEAGAGILYDGLPVQNWMVDRVRLILCANLVVSGKIRAGYKFKKPLKVTASSGNVRSLLASCSISFSYSGTWVAFQTRISASNGIYDWLKKSVRAGPGAFSIDWKDAPVGVGGKPLHDPPKELFPDWPRISPEGFALHNQVDLPNRSYLLLPASLIPNLDPLIEKRDLNPFSYDLPDSFFYPSNA